MGKTAQVKGKRLGCVALKNIKIGTLILNEKPQIITEGTAPDSRFFRSLSESFKNLQFEDQESYMKLPNRIGKDELLAEISMSSGGWATSCGVLGENPFMDRNQKKILFGKSMEYSNQI